MVSVEVGEFEVRLFEGEGGGAVWGVRDRERGDAEKIEGFFGDRFRRGGSGGAGGRDGGVGGVGG